MDQRVEARHQPLWQQINVEASLLAATIDQAMDPGEERLVERTAVVSAELLGGGLCDRLGER
jgi:hypothetical protein